MKHLMIDLETMGNKNDSPIVSIGAVFFDPATGELGADFYKVICLESAMAHGALPDASTIIWWLKQSSEARAAITVDDAVSINDALIGLCNFITRNCEQPGWLQVWGNGASFDNVILRSAYDRSMIPSPWKWFNDRDVRTIVELGRAIGFDPKKQMPFEGVQHNALADAVHQAKYVSAIWQRLSPPTSASTDVG